MSIMRPAGRARARLYAVINCAAWRACVSARLSALARKRVALSAPWPTVVKPPVPASRRDFYSASTLRDFEHDLTFAYPSPQVRDKSHCCCSAGFYFILFFPPELHRFQFLRRNL
ncbi:hypothetical protein PUN28_013002 [Cardiocondyla obscurior]|uniref:Secreted protein n=1 Tax=Cardiocondyla obscurior TaxID=286306 RepID=A0AAW2F6H8_9HYME